MTVVTLAKRRLQVGPATPQIISEFQPNAVEIEERNPPRMTRITLYLVGVLIAAAVIWASLSTVDEIVTAQGKLIAIHPNLVVQPLETSVIREIHVAVGDVVHRGQALATLDPTFSKADVDALRTRIAAFEATIERLEAELNARDLVQPDPANPEDAAQARLYTHRKGYYQASLNNYDAQISSLQAELETNKSEAALTANTLRSIEAMRSELMRDETGSRLNFLLSQASRLEVEDSLSHMRGDQVDLTDKLEKTRAKRQVFTEPSSRLSGSFREASGTPPASRAVACRSDQLFAKTLGALCRRTPASGTTFGNCGSFESAQDRAVRSIWRAGRTAEGCE